MQTGMREDTDPILFDDFPNVVATIAIALATAIAIVPDDILRVSFARIDGTSTAEQESGHRHDDEIRDRNANVHDGLRGKPRCRAAQAPDSPCALYL